jgi:general L-amino acid transport system substrate-binding protein
VESVIQAGGNYGEVFGRNLGKTSPLGMARGANALWSDGGLMYAPPMP